MSVSPCWSWKDDIENDRVVWVCLCVWERERARENLSPNRSSLSCGDASVSCSYYCAGVNWVLDLELACLVVYWVGWRLLHGATDILLKSVRVCVAVLIVIDSLSLRTYSGKNWGSWLRMSKYWLPSLEATIASLSLSPSLTRAHPHPC